MKAIIHLMLMLALVSCTRDEKGKNNQFEQLQKKNPISAIGHKWNLCLNYLPFNSNSIFLIREDFLYGDYTVIEFTNFTEGESRELRLYEFDLMTANKEYQRRSSPVFSDRKSKLRNIQTFIFDFPDTIIPRFKDIQLFDKKKYEINSSSPNKKFSYFLLDSKKNSLYWINPNDGISMSEKKILNWLKPFVSKISCQEKLYFEYVVNQRDKHSKILSKEEIIKQYGDSFLIPSVELRWNVN